MRRDKKPDILPVDKDTHELMRHYNMGSLYYVPNTPYDDYDFLKILSMKRKGGDKKDDDTK